MLAHHRWRRVLVRVARNAFLDMVVAAIEAAVVPPEMLEDNPPT